MLKTLKGSPIQRDPKYGVGKRMGSKIYVHKDYANSVVLPCMLRAYETGLPLNFEYNCICYDEKKKTIRFDEAPFFDRDREPKPGITYTVTEDGQVIRRVIKQIWHHKWLWVEDDYKGFDVEVSRMWSEYWLSKVAETASGYPDKWEQQLYKYGIRWRQA